MFFLDDLFGHSKNDRNWKGILEKGVPEYGNRYSQNQLGDYPFKNVITASKEKIGR